MSLSVLDMLHMRLKFCLDPTRHTSQDLETTHVTGSFFPNGPGPCQSAHLDLNKWMWESRRSVSLSVAFAVCSKLVGTSRWQVSLNAVSDAAIIQ